MPAPELVLLFADADAERFVTRLIERGIERGCLRSFSWRSVRDPMHDARVARDPAAALAPLLEPGGRRYVVLWDHQGSGRDDRAPADVEAEVVGALGAMGVEPERVRAIAFDPELEVVFLPVWDRVLDELAKKRGALRAPTSASATDPKASFRAAVNAHRLRASPALFDDLARELSIEKLKAGAAMGRVAGALVEWFGGKEGA